MSFQLVDSHCHLDCLNLEGRDLDEVIGEAKAAGICHMLNVCTHLETFPKTLSIGTGDTVKIISILFEIFLIDS